MRDKLRLELEFENINDEKQDVVDVEDIKKKEARLLGAYIKKQDLNFTSGHLKAARVILKELRRRRFFKLAVKNHNKWLLARRQVAFNREESNNEEEEKVTNICKRNTPNNKVGK